MENSESLINGKNKENLALKSYFSNNQDFEEQFLRRFQTLSQFGSTSRGGVDRQAASKADDEQRIWFIKLLKQYGASVSVDSIGNIFGQWIFDPDLPTVFIGSHLDSQPLAGKFDGAYGVLNGLFACAFNADLIAKGHFAPKTNIGVVNWFNEEGSRFQPSMMGSSVFTKKLPLDEALSAEDSSQITVSEALATISSNGSDPQSRIDTYIEIHVEQGKILEENNINIGVVHQTWASRKHRVEILGEQSHTGSTLMQDRKDAMLGAAHLIIGLREIADSLDIHTSVGYLKAEPNSPVVVARRVELLADMRASNNQLVEHAAIKYDELLSRIRSECKVIINDTLEHSWEVSSFDSNATKLAEAICDEINLSHTKIPTIAGHDSTNLKDIVPTMMLFIPSHEGVAHNEAEFTSNQDMLNGLSLTSNVIYKICKGEYSSNFSEQKNKLGGDLYDYA